MECMAVGLTNLSHLGVVALRIIGTRMGFIDANAAFQRMPSELETLRTTTEDNGVLTFVNLKLSNVTNVGRAKCFW
jgi:hypothetical protein